MKMKAEITNITIKLKGRNIELTVEEAHAICSELHTLFTHAEHKRVDYIPVPYPVFPAPVVIERGPWWPNRWDIICGTPVSGGTICMSVGQATC